MQPVTRTRKCSRVLPREWQSYKRVIPRWTRLLISPITCNADRAPAEASVFASQENRNNRHAGHNLYISEFLLTADKWLQLHNIPQYLSIDILCCTRLCFPHWLHEDQCAYHWDTTQKNQFHHPREHTAFRLFTGFSWSWACSDIRKVSVLPILEILLFISLKHVHHDSMTTSVITKTITDAIIVKSWSSWTSGPQN